ncbi:MAG: hypothetical protein KF745_13395 [Phycisphaeraceae bacterium]|nr:hypothetical protein [Phycisphaeraceae bacterium]
MRYRTSKQQRRLVTLAAGLGSFAAVSGASAQVLNPNNGHYYQAITVPEGISWESARVLAETLTYSGMNGYLVTFTTEQEMNWFASYENRPFLGDAMNDHYWIGGYKATPGPDPAQGWAWVTGEPFTYTNWSANEPNNMGGHEDSLVFWTWDGTLGRWNDDPGEAPAMGFVVEYSSGNLVPSPGPVALMLLGGGIAMRRRR